MPSAAADGLGDDGAVKIDPVRLIISIESLVNDYNCDIIVFSCGDSPVPLRAVRAALQRAEHRGVLCIAAAGNAGDAPLYPACYPEVMAIGAVAAADGGPAGTYEHAQWDSATSSHIGGEQLSLWRQSARGVGVDFLAPGVGVFAQVYQGFRMIDTGTSFAAPLAAGVAAIVLASAPNMPRSRSRVEFLRKALEVKAISFGSASAHGLVTC